MEQIDPLVERVAAVLYERTRIRESVYGQQSLPEWKMCHDSAQSSWRVVAEEFIKALSEPLPDGTRLVRTKANQTLPKNPFPVGSPEFMAFSCDMLNAGWLKCGPVAKE